MINIFTSKVKKIAVGCLGEYHALRLRILLNSVRAFFGFKPSTNKIGGATVPFTARFESKATFAQQGEDLLLDRILRVILQRDLNGSGTYVDIGAFDAVEHSVTYLLYLRGWTGIAFDPSIKTAHSFKVRRPNDIFVNAVVGEQDGVKVDFYIPNKAVTDKSLISTKYPSVGAEHKYRKTRFPQVNINEELKRQGFWKIDVLNIDVEGAELEILKTLDFDTFRPAVIVVEIHGNDLHRCLKTQVAKLLISKGYTAVASAVITYFFVLKCKPTKTNGQ